MATISLRSHICFQNVTSSITKQTPLKTTSQLKTQFRNTKQKQINIRKPQSKFLKDMILGTVSIGVMVLVMGFDEHKALAMGEPLMEEFWDNMRRYGLYILTVSTGVLSAVFDPIFDLLKNPITALLIFIIFGATFYIVSQVVSAMVGVSDFDYQYQY